MPEPFRRYAREYAHQEVAMSHRPYPNADRALRQVTLRHGSDCPRCGHRDHAHPRTGGQYVCSRERNGVPSCRECAARQNQLLHSPLGGMVRSLSQISVQMPALHFVPPQSVAPAGYKGPLPNVAMTVSPGRAVLPGGVSGEVEGRVRSIAEAVRRGAMRMDPPAGWL